MCHLPECLIHVASGQSIAGGQISRNSILLSKEVVKAMLITKIQIAAVTLCAACAAIGSSTVVERQMLAAPPDNIPVVTVLAQAFATQSKAVNQPAEKKDPADPQWDGLNDEQIDEISLRHLKAVVYAMHAYLEKNGTFPLATVPNPKLPIEKRLSGFVLLLPYLGVRRSWLPENDEGWQKWHADNAAAKQLFDKIDLKKAWDDPVNATAAKTILLEFVVPGGAQLRDKRGYAISHFAFVRGSDGNDNGAFPLEPAKGLTIKDFPDGTSVTLAIGQIRNTLVPWIAAGTSTARFVYHPADKSGKPSFGGPYVG